MNATEQYIKVLTNLKAGDLGLLRAHSQRGLDESVTGFDLFAGLWWPLRQQKGGPPPRREVSWLIAKLYAFSPIPQSPGDTLASQLRLCRTDQNERFRQRFDRLLILPVNRIEPTLQWALACISSNTRKLDWVQLAKDLSHWERESTRLEWARQFVEINEREPSC